jgi:hypothetical protein
VTCWEASVTLTGYSDMLGGYGDTQGLQ